MGHYCYILVLAVVVISFFALLVWQLTHLTLYENDWFRMVIIP